MLRWAHVVTWQVDRLRDSRLRAMRSTDRVREFRYYGHMDAHPFQETEGERLFVLISARQLVRALEAFEGELRLPAALDRNDLELIRNAAEHWDEPNPTKGWVKKAAERRIDPTLHRWSPEARACSERFWTRICAGGRLASTRKSGRLTYGGTSRRKSFCSL